MNTPEEIEAAVRNAIWLCHGSVKINDRRREFSRCWWIDVKFEGFYGTSCLSFKDEEFTVENALERIRKTYDKLLTNEMDFHTAQIDRFRLLADKTMELPLCFENTTPSEESRRLLSHASVDIDFEESCEVSGGRFVKV